MMDNKTENKNKNIVGEACVIGILVASLFSNICTILKVDMWVLNEIKEAIMDASLFLNIICISYLVTSLRTQNKRMAVECIADLILINQLYSNRKLFEIGAFLKKYMWRVNSYIIFLICIVSLACIVFVGYKLYRKKKISKHSDNKRAEKEYNGVTAKEQQGFEEINPGTDSKGEKSVILSETKSRLEMKGKSFGMGTQQEESEDADISSGEQWGG